MTTAGAATAPGGSRDGHRPPTPRPTPTPDNLTLMQAFEWYVPADGNHYSRLEKQIPKLKAWGIDSIWLPPGCKGASGPDGNGYDIYDLYDIGEFDQKGSVRTKWGTRQELESLCEVARRHGVGLLWDVVINHLTGADWAEQCRACEVQARDRTVAVGKPKEIEAWTQFDYYARGGAHSKMTYRSEHFSGVDWDHKEWRKSVFKIMRDQDSEPAYPPAAAIDYDVDEEYGNYDYLMGADLDYSHPDVRAAITAWGEWIASSLPISGMRFDAARHFSRSFLEAFIMNMRNKFPDRAWFFVAEVWKYDVGSLCRYLDKMGENAGCVLFDSLLAKRWGQLTVADGGDLRKVFHGTLTQARPDKSVTIVMTHDTEPGQTLDTPVAQWLKPLAYALILLRRAGHPCIFYGDLYGTLGERPLPPIENNALLKLVLARKLYAYGEQEEYSFGRPGGGGGSRDDGGNEAGKGGKRDDDDGRVIGWVRGGAWDRPAGCAVLMSCDRHREGRGRMCVGKAQAGQTWTDILAGVKKEGAEEGERQDRVVIGEDGFGEFVCRPRNVAVFVRQDAEGRERFGPEFEHDIYDWQRK